MRINILVFNSKNNSKNECGSYVSFMIIDLYLMMALMNVDDEMKLLCLS